MGCVHEARLLHKRCYSRRFVGSGSEVKLLCSVSTSRVTFIPLSWLKPVCALHELLGYKIMDLCDQMLLIQYHIMP
jgi:hypothetical protein